MPLDIIIIGAGPAGLAAAIYLARANHTVRLYEKATTFQREGWTLNIYPPGRALLQDLGVESALFSTMDWAVIRDIRTGMELVRSDSRLTQKELNTPFRPSTIDRSDLHQALRNLVKLEKRVQVHWGVTISQVDLKGKIFFENGKSDSADLVIGADGIHSVAFRSFPIPPVDQVPNYVFDAVRLPVRHTNCVLDVVEARADPELSKFFEDIDVITSLGLFTTGGIPHKGGPIYGPNALNWICLPSRHGKLWDISPVEADPKAADYQGPWTIPITREEFCDLARTDVAFKGLQSVTKYSRNFERWTLGYRDCATTFVQGRVALIGDAAHPQHPNDGAGTSIAVEDAAALATLLTDAQPKDIPRRLKLYDRLRYVGDLQVKYIGDYIRPPGTGTSAEMYKKLDPGHVLPTKSFVGEMLWTDDPINNAKKMLEREVRLMATRPTWRRILGLGCL